MILSLNETRALAQKAARGAGYPWGLAEEAAFATTWLCQRGQQGCEALVALLDAGFATDLSLHMPGSVEGTWVAQDALCPIATGASLSDAATRLLEAPIQLRNIAIPIFVVPFVAQAAKTLNTALQMEWADQSTVVTTDAVRGSYPDQNTLGAVAISKHTGQVPVTDIIYRVDCADNIYERLNAYAFKTYAPASEASRKGAGSALSDND